MEEIKGLYHTHSKYSKFNHGKNTVREMVEEAKRLGLEEIAITDHGCKHIFGIRKNNIKKLRNDIDQMNSEGGINAIMGLELNLLGNNGEYDLPEKYSDLLDIKLLGVHKAGRVGFKAFFNFLLPNLFCRKSKKRIDKNTDAYINAIKLHNIDIITHPNEYFLINPYKLADGCAKNNCYIEINNKHLKLTKDDIEQMLKTDVKFIISSDAHSVDRIKNIGKALEFAKECKIPEERIANLNKLPDFKNKYPESKTKAEKIDVVFK